jgi:hypothetical protein
VPDCRIQPHEMLALARHDQIIRKGHRRAQAAMMALTTA